MSIIDNGLAMLQIVYDEKDTGLQDQLKEDLSWFGTPISQSQCQSTAGTIMRVKMKDNRTTVAASFGLQVRYPGLDISIIIEINQIIIEIHFHHPVSYFM